VALRQLKALRGVHDEFRSRLLLQLPRDGHVVRCGPSLGDNMQ
jgi:hypothetical protein